MLSLRILPVVAACSLTAFAAAQSRDFRRVIPIGSRPDVYVSTGSGSIRLTAATSDQITVIGHVRPGGRHTGDIEARMQRIVDNPPIQQSGNTLRIGDEPEQGLLNNISIDYEVQLPPDSALNLRSGSGDIEVAAVGRFLTASSGSGVIRVRDVHGPAELQTGSGDVELYQSGQGDVKARTGSGSLHLHGLNGPLSAHTGSGSIEADGRVQGPGELSTGSGSIRLRLAPETHVNLTAYTGSGDLRVHLPGLDSLAVEHHRVSGAVNGGGPELQVHTGSGNIEIASAP